MLGGTFSGLKPFELSILVKGKDGELLLAEPGKPTLELYLREGRIFCARVGKDPLSWAELVTRCATFFRAREVAFLFLKGVRPVHCSLILDRDAERLVQEAAELSPPS